MHGWAAVLPVDVAVGPPCCGLCPTALPSPASSSAPSAAAALPPPVPPLLLEKTRLRGRILACRAAAERRRAARVFDLLCFLSPVLTKWGRDKEERGIRYEHPRLYPEVSLLLLCDFLVFFFPIRYQVCVTLPFVAVQHRRS